jgi:hypothetical protein
VGDKHDFVPGVANARVGAARDTATVAGDHIGTVARDGSDSVDDLGAAALVDHKDLLWRGLAGHDRLNACADEVDTADRGDDNGNGQHPGDHRRTFERVLHARHPTGSRSPQGGRSAVVISRHCGNGRSPAIVRSNTSRRCHRFRLPDATARHPRRR